MPDSLAAAAGGPMRILWLVDSLGEAWEDAQVGTFLQALDRSSVRVELLALDGRRHPPLEQRLASLGIPVQRLDAGSPRDLPAFLRLLRRVRGGRYHLVHTHLPWASLWGAFAARLADVPVVATLYGGAPAESGSTTDLTLERRGSWALRRWARRVIAISGAQWDRYVSEGAFSRTMLDVVYQGVEPGAFPPPDPGDAEWLRNRAGFPGASPVAVTAVRMDHLDSGVDVLLWAIPEILEAVPQARFVIAGEGALKGEFQRRVRARGLNQRVYWSQEEDDLARIFRGGDLLIHPTLRDPFPTAVLEAMAARLPVVATRVGGVPEIIGSSEVGRLVPRSSSEALARAVVELLREPARLPAMGEAARGRVVERFSAREWVDRTEAVYQAVVREVRAGTPRPEWSYARLSVQLLGRTA